MRVAYILLTLASLSACNAEKSDRTAAPGPAPLTFERAAGTDHDAIVAHGRRVARLVDCTGCHGSNLQGQNATADEPNYGKMYAPNVTLLLAGYTDRDLDRLIRHGEPKNGREFWFMPVESFQFLSDPDLAALIAYLRSLKPEGKQLPPIEKGKGFYKDLKRGIGNSRQQVARFEREQPADLGPRHARGRYYAQTMCTGCHNGALQGYRGFTPNLNIAGAYSATELTRLLATGEGKTKKNLGMMSGIARGNFSQMTVGERAALVAYIEARAHRPNS